EIRREGRNVLIETIVDLDHYFVDRGPSFLLGKVQMIRNGEGKGRIAALVGAHGFSVDKYLGLLVGRLEMQEDPFVLKGSRDVDFSFVPGNPTVVSYFIIDHILGVPGMGDGNIFPTGLGQI